MIKFHELVHLLMFVLATEKDKAVHTEMHSGFPGKVLNVIQEHAAEFSWGEDLIKLTM